MAVQERTPPAGLDLQGITSLANLFLGKDSTQTTSGSSQNTGGVNTTGTRTVSEGVPPEAVQAIVQSIMQGSQGLAAVASGQNKAGLYNSSTNRMLVNDLMARAAAEGAKTQKTTTTTINENAADTRGTVTNNAQNTKVQAPISAKTAGTGLLGLQGLSLLKGTGVGKGILSKLGLGKAAGGGAGAIDNSVSAAGDPSGVDQATAASTSSAPQVANVSEPITGGQSVGSFSGSDINGLDSVSNTSDVASLSELSFDQTADFSGFDFGVGVGGEVAGDAINGLDLNADYSFADVGGDFMDGGMGDWGPDPGSIDYTGDFSFEDFGPGDWGGDLFDFADGGLVTKDGNESLLKKRYVNVAAEKAFDSGGDESPKDSGGPQYTKDGVDFFRKAPQQTMGNDPRAAQSDKPNKSMAVRIIDKITGRDKTPGYANGGLVRKNYATGGAIDTTNMGLRVKGPQSALGLSTTGNAEQAIGGVLTRQNLRTDGGVAGQSSSLPSRGTSATNSPTSSSGSRQTIRGRNNRSSNINPVQAGQDAGSSGENDGTTSGQVGTPAENAAAIAGMAGMAGGLALGIPSVAVTTAMNIAGINTSSMNPVSNAVTAIANMISEAVSPNSMSNVAAAASAANASPSQSDDNAAVANAIADDNNMDPLDALVGMLDDSGFDASIGGGGGNDGTSAEGGGIGGSGNSAGEGSGSDGSGDGGASASAKDGGMIRGKGTSTSDSIKANLSDGEYVIKAAAVDYWGKDFFDRLNSAVSTK